MMDPDSNFYFYLFNCGRAFVPAVLLGEAEPKSGEASHKGAEQPVDFNFPVRIAS